MVTSTHLEFAQPIITVCGMVKRHLQNIENSSNIPCPISAILSVIPHSMFTIPFF